MDSRIPAELAHLVRYAETGPGWYAYAMGKAQSLAVQEPAVWNELPLLLSNELRSRKHGPPRSSMKK